MINYLSCGVLWFGLSVKLSDLVRDRRNPFLRTICAVMALAGLCFLLGAPPTVGAVNRITNVPNLAAPLTYAAITAYSASSLVLIVHWRGGPNVRRTARRWVLGYALVLAGIAVTFAAGDAPVERRTDFDTYYATTPFVSVMILLYLLAHLTAVTVTAVWSLNWAREVRGRLRAGLLTLGVGTVVSAGYSVSKLAAVVARWCGQDWSALGTRLSPGLAGLGAVTTVVGILIPLVGQALALWRRSWRSFVRLEPLDRELDELLTRRGLRLRRPPWASPAVLLTWRRTSINNGLHHLLDGWSDRGLYEAVFGAALRSTGDRRKADAAAWAAVIVAAARAEREGRRPSQDGRMAGRLPEVAGLEDISRALTASDRPAAGSRAVEGVV
ncbi:MAB_1171c family putative transporter [Streptomyces beigongshangae]|uniref:MAB_1171c family putative transporter n=1 Tax=Streptomyces beigongshangae TaxID=2841597 RepID=UPI0027E0E8BA|nr:MAB_1171c family putative transporter [Streptomyces sp. REN17]